MRIDHIRLRNFRGFTDFELELHPSMTVLVGGNGAGKTSLIDALAMCASAFMGPLHAPPHAPQKADVRRKVFTTGGGPDLQPQLPISLDWQMRLGSSRFKINGTAAESGWLRYEGDSSQLINCINNLQLELQGGKASSLPLICRIQADRAWEAQIKTQDVWQGQRQKGYESWARPAANQSQMMAWVRKFTLVELQEGPGAVPQLGAVKRAIREAVPKTTDVEYRVREEELRLSLEDGSVLAFHELSDGLRNMVATVADIAWRAAVLNPQLEGEAIKQTEGMVLIDEIELHLHPLWQREVLPMLRRVFPALQFVVTTHSPQVVASAKRDWVRLFHDSGATVPSFVEGRDSNSLLEDVFGVAGRPREQLDQVSDLFKQIDDENYSAAREILEELGTKMGPDDPDLIRARWMLDAEEE